MLHSHLYFYHYRTFKVKVINCHKRIRNLVNWFYSLICFKSELQEAFFGFCCLFDRIWSSCPFGSFGLWICSLQLKIYFWPFQYSNVLILPKMTSYEMTETTGFLEAIVLFSCCYSTYKMGLYEARFIAKQQNIQSTIFSSVTDSSGLCYNKNSRSFTNRML